MTIILPSLGDGDQSDDIALDKKTRAYAKVTAIDTAFKILQ